MHTVIHEFPKHPIPDIPQPQTPQRPHAAPTIYVYEKQKWEYKTISRKAGRRMMSDAELSALGESGWELVGVVPLAREVQFYFKRART